MNDNSTLPRDNRDKERKKTPAKPSPASGRSTGTDKSPLNGLASTDNQDNDNDLDLITTAESSHELYQDFKLNHEEEPRELKTTIQPGEMDMKSGMSHPQTQRDPIELRGDPGEERGPQLSPLPGPEKSTSPNTEWVDDLLSDIIMEAPAIEQKESDQPFFELTESPLPLTDKINEIDLSKKTFPEIIDTPLEELPVDEVLDEIIEGPEPAKPPPLVSKPAVPPKGSPDVLFEAFSEQNPAQDASPLARPEATEISSSPGLPEHFNYDLEEIKDKLATIQLEIAELMNNQTKMMKILRQFEDKFADISTNPHWWQSISSRFRGKE